MDNSYYIIDNCDTLERLTKREPIRRCRSERSSGLGNTVFSSGHLGVFFWQSWRKSESEDATDVMNIIQNDRIMGALSQGTVAAAIVSSSLASGKVEPEFLARWWLIILATSFSCVMITKSRKYFSAHRDLARIHQQQVSKVEKSRPFPIPTPT